jgi:hypothetical protein
MHWSRPAVLLTIVLLAGCRTTPMARSSGERTLVYRPVATAEFNDRVAELTKVGYSRERAERKARREFAGKAWTYDDSQAWAAEKAREQRSAEREKMDKALASLPNF